MYRRNCSCQGKNEKGMGMYPGNMNGGQWAAPQTAPMPMSQPMNGVAPTAMTQPQMSMPNGYPPQAAPVGMPWDTAGMDPSLLGQQQGMPQAAPMMMPQSMPGAMPGYGAGPMMAPMMGATPAAGMPWGQQQPGAMPVMQGTQTPPMNGMQHWPSPTPYSTGGCC